MPLKTKKVLFCFFIEYYFLNLSFFKIIVAIKALKTKKRFEKQLQQVDGALTTLEYQREVLENSHTNAEVLKTMALAAKSFKQACNLDIDTVNELRDEMAEQQGNYSLLTC